MDLIKSLPKTACVDTLKKCNEVEPYSKTILEFGKNPATGEKYTEDERDEKQQQFDNMCKGKNNTVLECCDPSNKLYSEFKNDMSNIKAKKIKKRGEVVGYELCDTNIDDCSDETFKSLTPHDMCKLSGSLDEIETGSVKEVSTLVPDCYSAVCSKERYVPFISDPFAVETNNAEEYNMLQELKNDNLFAVKKYYNDNGLNTLGKPLKNGYTGNTILHEAIAYDSQKVLDFILENKFDYDIQNIDGNTPLHLAVLKGSEFVSYRLIKLGSNIQKPNNLGDSVLHSAVRGGNIKIVSILLFNNASVFVKNRLGETPLHTAVMTPDKSLKIIMSLTNQGSNLLTKNNNDETLCGSLAYFKKTRKNEAVRTYIQQEVYNTNFSDYDRILKEMPDLAFIEAVNKETGEKEDISQYKVDKLDVEMPKETVSDSSLYGAKKAISTRESILNEGFTSSQLPDPLVLNDSIRETDVSLSLELGNELEEEDLESVKCDTKCVFKYSTFILFVIMFLVIILKFAL